MTPRNDTLIVLGSCSNMSEGMSERGGAGEVVATLEEGRSVPKSDLVVLAEKLKAEKLTLCINKNKFTNKI